MEWGLHEDKAMWNEDHYSLSHAVSRMFIWRKVMLSLIRKHTIQIYESTCV